MLDHISHSPALPTRNTSNATSPRSPIRRPSPVQKLSPSRAHPVHTVVLTASQPSRRALTRARISRTLRGTACTAGQAEDAYPTRPTLVSITLQPRNLSRVPCLAYFCIWCHRSAYGQKEDRCRAQRRRAPALGPTV